MIRHTLKEPFLNTSLDLLEYTFNLHYVITSWECSSSKALRALGDFTETL